MAPGDAWIETTSYLAEARTLWVIRVDQQIVKVGEIAADPAGAVAYESALAWAQTLYPNTTFGWKHHVVKTAITTPKLVG